MGDSRHAKRGLSFKKKIGISIFSLFFFLILLEVILRAVGNFYSLKRIAPDEVYSSLDKKEGAHTILCVGDSFTFGGDLPFDFSYPFQLKRMLNTVKSDRFFRVINGGICEQNSAQLLKALPKDIKYYKPDTVILLVGASNWFNFIGLNNKEKAFHAKLRDLLYDLRVVKMAKIMAFNLEQRFLIMKYKHKSSAKSYKFLYDYYSFRPVIDSNVPILKEMAEIRLKRVDCLREIGEDEKASQLFNEIMKVDPDSDLYMYQVADFLEHIHRTLGLTGGEKYDPALVSMFFQRKLENSREAKERMFMDYFLLFKSIQNSFKNEEIEKRLREDLDGIVDLCKKNNIKLIIQDYPFPYPLADLVIKDISVKHSLPLVRNSKVFGELLAKEKKEAYFLTDTHCTPLGYKVMAEDVYNVLLSENITSK